MPLTAQILINRTGSVLLIGLLLAGVGGCFGGDGPVVSLKSDDPAGKIPAIKQAGQRKDRSALPVLVSSLDDEDPAVRFYAIESLQRITGQTFGYHYFEDETRRAPAIQRWNDWLTSQKK